MFGRAIRLPFTLFGIPVLLDWTFLIILPVFAWLIARQMPDLIGWFNLEAGRETLLEGWTPYVLGLFAAIGLFISVLIHELGHSLVARRYGVKVKSIRLWLLGGVAQFEDMPRQRGAEAVVAIVGPIVSVAVGTVCFFIVPILPVTAYGARFVFEYLAVLNYILAVFNLIPALPLDGGRVLRSLLAMKMSHLRATQISAGVAKFFAVVLALLGILGNFWLLIIAFFIYMAVNAETQNSLVIEMLQGIDVRHLMTRNVKTVPADLPLADLPQRMFAEHHLGFPVVNESGQVVGMVSLRNLERLDGEGVVGQIMSRPVSTIHEDASALDAFQLMGKNNFGRVVVTDDAGGMVGIITKTDLMRAIQIRMAEMNQEAFWSPGEREDEFSIARQG